MLRCIHVRKIKSTKILHLHSRWRGKINNLFNLCKNEYFQAAMSQSVQIIPKKRWLKSAIFVEYNWRIQWLKLATPY